VSRRIRKYTKETREHLRKHNGVYRNEITTGFNLLKKWVPGTETLTRPALLMSAVNYIKELLNKVKELEKESTPLKDCETGMERDSVPNTEQNCTDSTPREPLMPEINSSPMETDISEPEMVDRTPVVVSTPMEIGASEEIPESVIVSPEEEEELLVSPEEEEELLVSPEEEEELLVSPDEEEELLVSPEEEEELLRSPDEKEELPEFNSIEDLRQWLEL
jgi:hypothetical protein